MVGSEAICDREQCRYIGPIPEPPNLLGRILASAGIAMVFHFGCFPLSPAPLLPVHLPDHAAGRHGADVSALPGLQTREVGTDRHASRPGPENAIGAIQHEAIKGERDLCGNIASPTKKAPSAFDT